MVKLRQILIRINVPQRSCGKVMFLHVCHSVRGGCIPACTGADPPWAESPWPDTPLGRHTPLSRHPPQPGKLEEIKTS